MVGGAAGRLVLPQRWRALLALQADRNSELQLLLRATVASGVGLLGGPERLDRGLAHRRPGRVARDVQPITRPHLALDLLVGASWDAFRYDTPKLDLNASFVLFPGLTDFGRLRGTFTLKVKYEIFRDFNVGLAFNDTFDTSPRPTAPNNDFITSLTVGWSYRR